MMNNGIKKVLTLSWLKQGLVLLALSSTTLTSCDSLLEVDSRHIVNEENKWKDINDARASLMGIYGLVRTALSENNAQWVYGDLRAGDFIAPEKRELQEVIEGNLTSSNALITNLSNWRKFYAAINAANLFISNSERIVGTDPQYTELNNKIDVAQARALKGFCYFQIARIWGDAPIWDKAHEGSFPAIETSSSDQVLAYAERELKAAATVLPYRYGSKEDEIYAIEKYHGSSFENWDGVLFNRLSVNAILAHLTAWQGKYLESSVYSDFVLTNAAKAVATYANSATFTSPEGYFFVSSNSHLVAFPSKWSALEASFEGHIEQLTLAAPLVSKPKPDIYIPIERIMQIFHDPKDLRFHVNETGQTVTSYFSEVGGIRPIFSKIKVIRGGTTDGSFPLFSSTLVFSRLEDMALLRAEAMAVLGGNDDAVRGLLNQVRRSRGLAEVGQNVDVINEIFEERRRELMGEGWRWFDLVRYHKIKKQDSQFVKLINEKGIYWPIAQEVLNNNRLLQQNPYWKN